MRLSEQQIEIIRNTAFNHFGDDVHVFLFGSRTDPHKKGGDIDLLISTLKEKTHLKQKLLFLVDLKKQLGDQKIDVVFDKKEKYENMFLKTINKNKLQLC